MELPSSSLSPIGAITHVHQPLAIDVDEDNADSGHQRVSTALNVSELNQIVHHLSSQLTLVCFHNQPDMFSGPSLTRLDEW